VSEPTCLPGQEREVIVSQVLALVAGRHADGPPPELAPPAGDDPEAGPRYFADLVRWFGRCTCPASRPDEFNDCAVEDRNGCALCKRLDPGWPCPTAEHRGYEQATTLALATVVAPEPTAAAPVAPGVAAEPTPVYADPVLSLEGWDDDADRPVMEGVAWDLSWGCRIHVGHEHAYEDDPERWTVSASLSDGDGREGAYRTVTPAQVRDFAAKLLALTGVSPDAIESATPAAVGTTPPDPAAQEPRRLRWEIFWENGVGVCERCEGRIIPGQDIARVADGAGYVHARECPR
jgi:hypothetical protein